MSPEGLLRFTGPDGRVSVGDSFRLDSCTSSPLLYHGSRQLQASDKDQVCLDCRRV